MLELTPLCVVALHDSLPPAAGLTVRCRNVHIEESIRRHELLHRADREARGLLAGLWCR